MSHVPSEIFQDRNYKRHASYNLNPNSVLAAGLSNLPPLDIQDNENRSRSLVNGKHSRVQSIASNITPIREKRRNRSDVS